MTCCFANRCSLLVFVIGFCVLSTAAVLRTPAQWRHEWDLANTTLVTNSVYHKVSRGWSAPLRYPFELTEDLTADWRSDRTAHDYHKMFGLQVYVLAAMSPREPAAMEQFLMNARYVAAILSAGVLSWIITLIAQRCGVPAGVALIAILAIDGRYMSFLHSLYWLPALGLAPLALVLTFYSPAASTRRLLLLLAAFAAAVFVRALCGYEFISVYVLSAMAGVALQGRPAPWSLLLRHAVYFVLAGVIGFACGLAFHACWVALSSESWELAFQSTLGNAINRSVLASQSSTFAHYLSGVYGALAHDKVATAVLAIWGLALIVWLVWRRPASSAKPSVEPSLATLAVASALGLVASSSWLILMRVHVTHHPQYNNIVLCSSFIWFAVPFVVAVVRDAASAIGGLETTSEGTS